MKLGKILPSNEGRDAIHVAIECVKAGMPLRPGERVVVRDGIAILAVSGSYDGVVDPFLPDVVKAGQYFVMCLHPDTPIKLHHEWERLALPSAEAQDYVNKLAEKLKVRSEQLMDAAARWVEAQESWTNGCRFEGDSIPDQFWVEYEKLTGVKGSGNFLSCYDSYDP